ncbi:MAG: Fic family protein [Microbacteriaceae bacterium]
MNGPWATLLAKYPTVPADYQATPTPIWRLEGGAELATSLRRSTAECAVRRHQERRVQALVNDAALEGFAFAPDEVARLLAGDPVDGHTPGEIAQVRGLANAYDYALERAAERPLEPSQALADDIHLFIAAPLGLKSIEFRGDQRAQYAGPAVALGRGERFRALDARLIQRALDEGLERISTIRHPVLRGATWAAFSTYQQFYLDGNRRTARYSMNAILLSHGYDAILIPNRAKTQYEDALVASYKSGDLTPHIKFLLQHFDDSH